MLNKKSNENTYIDINECTSRGVCSLSPSIAALEELAMSFLQQIAHYILLLDDLGASNDKIKSSITSSLASLVSVNEFSDFQLYSIITNEYFIYSEVRKIYHNLVKEKGISPKILKRRIQFNSSTTVAKAISVGEKLLLSKNDKYSSEQKNLIEILKILLKSVSLNIAKLEDFAIFDDLAYYKMLNVLDSFNHNKVSVKNILNDISELSKLDNKLQLSIANSLLKSFDGITKSNVSHSTTKGKAILVSGNNFFDLLNILECTKDEKIDIYTHSNLLITHALNMFKRYPNLKGHYGTSTESCVVDFATFPGAILLTTNSQNNTEYLYRGRLFSNDYIVPDGVIKIIDNNYKPIIETAKLAKGFTKDHVKDSSVIGYDENVFFAFDEIIHKLNNGELNKLYIVGLDAHLEGQKEYFRQFFSQIMTDEFVISFSYESKNDNVLTINVGNYLPLAANLMYKFFEKYPIDSDKLVFIFTTCDVMTISSVVTLKSLSAKNLYMVQCSPTQINPVAFAVFSSKYNIKVTTSASNDLKLFRQNKSTR